MSEAFSVQEFLDRSIWVKHTDDIEIIFSLKNWCFLAAREQGEKAKNSYYFYNVVTKLFHRVKSFLLRNSYCIFELYGGCWRSFHTKKKFVMNLIDSDKENLFKGFMMKDKFYSFQKNIIYRWGKLNLVIRDGFLISEPNKKRIVNLEIAKINFYDNFVCADRGKGFLDCIDLDSMLYSKKLKSDPRFAPGDCSIIKEGNSFIRTFSHRTIAALIDRSWFVTAVLATRRLAKLPKFVWFKIFSPCYFAEKNK